MASEAAADTLQTADKWAHSGAQSASSDKETLRSDGPRNEQKGTGRGYYEYPRKGKTSY